MNKLYEIKSLSFAYDDTRANILNDISFDIYQGDFIVVCGPSGCGKTTLLGHLKPSMTPEGIRSGSVKYMGSDISLLDDRKQASDIGYIFQNPESQIVTDYVWSELAFGLESLAYPDDVIRQKVADVASYYGLNSIYDKSTDEISGGEKQLVNLAAVMVMNPAMLILDEPVSRLDPVSASRYIDTLGRINRELGITIIISAHNLEELMQASTHLLIMDKGRLVNMYKKSDYNIMVNECGYHIADALPVESRIYAITGNKGECPFGIIEGRKWLEHAVKVNSGINSRFINKCSDIFKSNDNDVCTAGEPAVAFSNVYFAYSSKNDVIKNMTCRINKGEVYGVIGANGSGKSTFLSLACGIVKPSHGRIAVGDGLKLALLPQKPELLFRKKSVKEELEHKSFNQDLINDVVRQCSLNNLLLKNPYNLSGGERQRLALAIVMMTDADVILMDEPSKGMDAVSKCKLVRIIRDMAKDGKTIILVSHDIEFVAECTDRCGMLFDGAVISENDTHEFLLNNNYYTTQVVRLTRGIIDGCVRVSDVTGYDLTACDIENETDEKNCAEEEYAKEKYAKEEHADEEYAKEERVQKEKKSEMYIPKQNKNGFNILMLLIYAIMIPVTLWFGTAVLHDRKYYFIALMIVLESMIPFYISFERKKYSAKTVVVVALLCAIAVASRAAFYMVPGVKPIVAVVIISSVALGGELGFVIGSMSMLVSNILFGQGVWTPWQMFAMGMVGLISGLIFYKYRYNINRPALCITGFLLTLVVYGGIVDMSTLFYVNDAISFAVITATYLAGMPFNLLLAGSTVVFLWIMARTFIDKILRVVH